MLTFMFVDYVFEVVPKKKYFFLQCPSTVAEWMRIADEYLELWEFPNCLGSLDGKHIMIRKPSCSGSKFFNYKHFCSIILLALVDANYKFLFCDVGSQGRCSDAGVFLESDLNIALEHNILNIPHQNKLPGTNVDFPYCLISDEAFPLREYILKPYPQRNLTKKQRIYNYRICRARRCVENAFGIMANRFRVLLNHICVKPSKVDAIVLACCSMHNMLRTLKPSTYTVPDDTVDHDDLANSIDAPGSSQASVTNLPQARVSGRRSSTQTAKQNRDLLCDYFNSPVGAVPWQNDMI